MQFNGFDGDCDNGAADKLVIEAPDPVPVAAGMSVVGGELCDSADGLCAHGNANSTPLDMPAKITFVPHED